jgi:hypothetical protein
MEKSDPGCYPGSGMEKIGSGINIPDRQHCENRNKNCYCASAYIFLGTNGFFETLVLVLGSAGGEPCQASHHYPQGCSLPGSYKCDFNAKRVILLYRATGIRCMFVPVISCTTNTEFDMNSRILFAFLKLWKEGWYRTVCILMPVFVLLKDRLGLISNYSSNLFV